MFSSFPSENVHCLGLLKCLFHFLLQIERQACSDSVPCPFDMYCRPQNWQYAGHCHHCHRQSGCLPLSEIAVVMCCHGYFCNAARRRCEPLSNLTEGVVPASRRQQVNQTEIPTSPSQREVSISTGADQVLDINITTQQVETPLPLEARKRWCRPSGRFCPCASSSDCRSNFCCDTTDNTCRPLRHRVCALQRRFRHSSHATAMSVTMATTRQASPRTQSSQSHSFVCTESTSCPEKTCCARASDTNSSRTCMPLLKTGETCLVGHRSTDRWCSCMPDLCCVPCQPGGWIGVCRPRPHLGKPSRRTLAGSLTRVSAELSEITAGQGRETCPQSAVGQRPSSNFWQEWRNCSLVL